MATAVLNEEATGTTRRGSVGLMYGALCVVIVLQHIYLFTFNWYPELRLPLSASLAACHLVLAAVTILLRPAAWNMLLLAAAAVLLITIIPAHFLGLDDIEGHRFLNQHMNPAPHQINRARSMMCWRGSQNGSVKCMLVNFILIRDDLADAVSDRQSLSPLEISVDQGDKFQPLMAAHHG